MLVTWAFTDSDVLCKNIHLKQIKLSMEYTHADNNIFVVSYAVILTS